MFKFLYKYGTVTVDGKIIDTKQNIITKNITYFRKTSYPDMDKVLGSYIQRNKDTFKWYLLYKPPF